MKIALLLTGNELMAGDTVDSNSSMIAQKLKGYGFDVDCKITVGDDEEQLVEMMGWLSQRYAVVLVNGGLGPTADDLTSSALARLTDSDLMINVNAKAHLVEWCDRRKIPVNGANLKQLSLIHI